MEQIIFRPACESEQDFIGSAPHGPRAGWIIQRRKLVGRQPSQNVGIIELPFPVITPGDESGSYGVEHSRADAAGTLIEVAGILAKDRVDDHVSDDHVTYLVSVLSSETLRIALRPLAEFKMAVPRLVDSRGNAGAKQRNRIDDHFPAKVKFLRRCQRGRVRRIADEEIGKHAQQTLLLLGFQLLPGQFVRRQSNVYRGGRGSHLQYSV